MSLKHLASKLLISSILVLTGCESNESTTLSSSTAKVADGKFTDEIVSLATEQGRSISTRVLTPDGCEACPLIIFSHGANAAFDRYDALLLPLAKAGYRIAAPNHTDSEDHQNRAKYKRSDWLPTRLEDYNVIASQYETGYRIAAGHSFGALIAQIAGGTEIASDIQIDAAYGPKAVLAYSPPGPIPNYIGPQGWSKINVPTLITTGTQDIVPMMADKWELHLVSYESAPAENSFALIYENMNHYMNGAYGRETQESSTERERAMTHMVDSSLFFVSEMQDNGKVSAEDWETREQFFVEARTRQ